MNPGVTKLETLLAARRRRLDIADLIKMCALHGWLATHALKGKANGFQQSHERVSLCWTAFCSS
jgi:hypothetical protein